MKTILLMSDDIDMYRSLRDACVYLDINIIRATESYAGIIIARNLNLLAIFIDATKSLSYNGWVTARLIKNDPQLRNTRIVMLSDAKDASVRAQKSGCNLYMPRSFDPRETRTYLKTLLKSQVVEAYG